MFKDAGVPAGSKFVALTIGLGVTWLLMLLQIPFELVCGLIIPFFFDEAAMLLVNGLEFFLLPMFIANLVLPALVRQPAQIVRSVPPVIGEIIDMPPPMLA